MGLSQFFLDGHLMACSSQRPLAPEARPKTVVGTGPPAKPVLVRPTPQSWAPGSVAKAPKIPSKPVAVPILAQDWTAPESSECPSKSRDFPEKPG
jgi:myosin-15